MPGLSLRRALAVALAASVLTGCVGGDDDVADDEQAPPATFSAPETLPVLQIDATVPDATVPGDGGAFLAGVLADDAVSAEELGDAYRRYIECLADGGGAGRFAYDLELRTGLAVDWTIADEAAAGDPDVLGAGCSRWFLGDLTSRFERANPPADDLAARQRASIAACVEAVSPEAAANLPAEIAIGTAGEASSLDELQLDPAALDPASLGADADDIAAVTSCLASIGVEWQAFG